MNKKISLGAAISFMVVVVAITFCITMIFSLNRFNSKIVNIKEKDDINNKITQLDRIVAQSYAGEVDHDKLINAIARGYVSGIGDPYAMYYTAKELNLHNQTIKGIIMGIGINSQRDDSGYILVTKVYNNSPAASSGMHVGDLIISIDGQDIKAIDYSAAVEMLKGEAGTSVKLTYRRDTQDISAELFRKKIDIPSIEYSTIGTTAYMKISTFSDKTPAEFQSAYGQAIKDGMITMIIDIRGNSSSEYLQAAKVLDRILPVGNLGFEKSREGTVKPLAVSDADEISMPISVIVNSTTAGAGELFAACLQEAGKVKIVGTTTMGKGVIQQIFPLSDGSAVELTTSYVLTPQRKEINLVGIKPDFEVKLTAAQEKTAYLLDQNTDPQIKKALEVLTIVLPVTPPEQTPSPESSAPEPPPEQTSDTNAQPAT